MFDSSSLFYSSFCPREPELCQYKWVYINWVRISKQFTHQPCLHQSLIIQWLRRLIFGQSKIKSKLFSKEFFCGFHPIFQTDKFYIAIMSLKVLSFSLHQQLKVHFFLLSFCFLQNFLLTTHFRQICFLLHYLNFSH